MKMRIICALLFVMSLAFLGSCGGGGDSGSAGTGTVSMDIADAKPFIDNRQPDELWVTFEDVLVHTSGGGWASLDLPDKPFEINLLAFSDGLKTELATPTRIAAGHITQIRFVISRAYMVFYADTPGSDDEVEEIAVPSGTLRTDKQIDWTLGNGGSMSLTVHFDLSQSIVQSNQGYQLKPVLHLFNNEPEEAATICGSISRSSFVGDDDPQTVVVRVIWNGPDGDETYTVVTVPKDPDADQTGFCIYWVVPLEQEGESYTVEIDNGFDPPYTEDVQFSDDDGNELLPPGGIFDLNKGTEIDIPPTSTT
jgi:hypothetical protein